PGLRLADLVDRGHAPVLDRREGAVLSAEALAEALAVVVHPLERDLAAALDVVDQINLPHAAHAELAEDLVAAEDEILRLEQCQGHGVFLASAGRSYVGIQRVRLGAA